MKPFFNAQMKAWNQEAAADDLAPEVRQTIAHGETAGKNAGWIQAPDGAKEKFPSSPGSAALADHLRDGDTEDERDGGGGADGKVA
jgi:hypothetical protein